MAQSDQKGNKNPHWKGGRCKNTAGYIMIYMPTHPFATKDGYVREHRLVMEAYIGRVLLPTEIVHHINGITDDNRYENLLLFSRHGDHLRRHVKGKKFSEDHKQKIRESLKGKPKSKEHIQKIKETKKLNSWMYLEKEEGE